MALTLESVGVKTEPKALASAVWNSFKINSLLRKRHEATTVGSQNLIELDASSFRFRIFRKSLSGNR